MPLDKLPLPAIERILAGGAAICQEAGIPIAGGHSIDVLEPIYGLVALGVVHPRELRRNRDARPGDLLILGKPLGIGILSAALKKGRLAPEDYATMGSQLDPVTAIQLGAGFDGGVFHANSLTGNTPYATVCGAILASMGANLDAVQGAKPGPRIHNDSHLPDPEEDALKVLVPVKRVVDYNVKVRVKADGTGVDIANVKMSMKELAGLDQVLQLPGNEEVDADVVDAILEEASKFASNVLSPINFSGDQEGAHWADKAVTVPAGFKEAYLQFAENGWTALPCDPEYGGQGLPKLVATAVNEMWKSSNMAFALCPMLTAGAIEALLTAGSDELKQKFLPKMVDGTWTGTMVEHPG